MTEHTCTSKLSGDALRRFAHVPHTWPVGAEVTVTWTEPDPEPTGRWVNITWAEDRPPRPMWQDSDGDHWTISQLYRRGIDMEAAEAALVDLIESDHLPPQMPSVDQAIEWMALNGYHVPGPTSTEKRQIIRGALDAAVAYLARNGGAT